VTAQPTLIVSTTPEVQGRPVQEYLGVVSGEAILGANFVRDMFARVRDVVGGRSGAYEKELSRAREIALEEMVKRAEAMGANAVVAVDLDYESLVLKQGGAMLLVTACGTAVRI
jgi:uncharacterized protein YbjQ (UPF0145 family)